jgi:hypothetical protein
MRSLLLFIGSVLYPAVMVIISPLLVVLYLLFGTLWLGRFIQHKLTWLVAHIGHVKTLHLQFLYKKQLVLRPKAVRFH